MASKRDVISHVQPDAPKKSTTPLETYTPNPHLSKSLGAQYGYALLGGIMGGVSQLLFNFTAKRPFSSGIHKYPIYIAIGASITYAIHQYKEKQWAERDAVIRHYISLHPEDFPAYDRVKIGDVLDQWVPIR